MEIIKSSRYILRALDQLLPEQVRKELQTESQYTAIESSDEKTAAEPSEKPAGKDT